MTDLARALAGSGDHRLVRIGVVKTGGATLKTCTVTIDGADNVCVTPGAPTLAANDIVAVLRDGNTGYVLGKVGTYTPPTTDPEAPPVPVEPTVRRRTATIKPYFTGTYRGGWRSGDELFQGDYGGYGLNTGAAFYGNALKALHADTSKPYSIVVSYKRNRGGDYSAQSPKFYTLTQKTKPAGAPTKDDGPSTGTAVAVGKTAKFELSSTMALHLLNGTDGGLGIYLPSSNPYVVLAGRSDYAAAMALTVTYYA
jgi:hypothetical protein